MKESFLHSSGESGRGGIAAAKGAGVHAFW